MPLALDTTKMPVRMSARLVTGDPNATRDKGNHQPLSETDTCAAGWVRKGLGGAQSSRRRTQWEHEPSLTSHCSYLEPSDSNIAATDPTAMGTCSSVSLLG